MQHPNTDVNMGLESLNKDPQLATTRQTEHGIPPTRVRRGSGEGRALHTINIEAGKAYVALRDIARAARAWLKSPFGSQAKDKPRQWYDSKGKRTPLHPKWRGKRSGCIDVSQKRHRYGLHAHML